jgi:hypothetical protein
MADGGANWWPFENKPVEIVPSPIFLERIDEK